MDSWRESAEGVELGLTAIVFTLHCAARPALLLDTSARVACRLCAYFSTFLTALHYITAAPRTGLLVSAPAQLHAR